MKCGLIYTVKKESFEKLAAQIYRELPRNPGKALRLSRKGISLAKRDSPPGCLAQMTLCRAHAFRECGKFAESLRDYDAAARLFRKDGLIESAYRTVIGKMDALDLSGKYEQALREARRASRYFHRAGLKLWEAKIHQNMGNIFQHTDRYSRALTFYNQAYRALSQERPLDGFIALFNQANIHLSTGNPEQALTLLKQCGNFFERESLSNLQGRVHYNLAYGYFLSGKYQDALAQLSTAKSIFSKLRDRAFLASCSLDQAEVYLRLNHVEEALRLAKTAKRQFRQLKMPYELAEANALLGTIFLRKDNVQEAIHCLQRARVFFEGRKNRVKSAELHSHIALAWLKKGDPEKAGAHLQRAYRMFATQRIYTRMLSCLVFRAAILIRKNEWRKARTVLRKAEAWISHVRLPWVLLPYHQILGKVETRLGNAAGPRELQKAIHLVERMRSEIPAEELQISYLQDKMEPFDVLILLELQKGRPSRAFEYAERARSRVLLDLMEGSLVFDPQHQTLQEELARLQAVRAESWRRNIGAGPAVSKRLEKVYEDRVLKIMRQGQRISDKKQTAPPSVEALIHGLLPGQTLLSFHRTNTVVNSFVLDRDGIHAFPVAAEDGEIRERWQLLRFHLERARLQSDPDPANGRMHQIWLGETLLGPAYKRLQDKQLITIFPHGWYHGLPFHSLMHRDGSYSDRHAFSYAPSASIYDRCIRAESRRKGELLLGYADEMAPLIECEIDEIRSVFPQAAVFNGASATSQRLFENAADAGIIHLAGHGRFGTDQPLFSGVLLADGWLTIPMIYQLRTRADLLTLSGCETGITEISGGDELLGLIRGFLYAGATSLLVSLWRVSDRSTAFFMKHFYTALASGEPKWKAWHLSLLKTRERWPHPYFWAPYLLIGNPR